MIAPGETTMIPTRTAGWRSGFANLLRKEAGEWWRTRRWLVQGLLWLVIVDGLAGLLLFVVPAVQNALPDPQAAALDAQEGGLAALFQLGMTALAIGVIVLAQDAITGERQSGITAWILSKPASRSAYFLAKLVAYGAAVLALLVGIPSLVGYLLLAFAGGEIYPAGPFLAAVALLALHTLFYLTLTLMMGVLSTNRAAILGVALGVLLGGLILPALLPGMLMGAFALTPWLLPNLGPVVAAGQGLPIAVVLQPVIATTVWCGVFVAVALWRFNRIEF